MQKTWYSDSPFESAGSQDPQQLEQQWRSLVEKTLNGSTLEERLISSTLDDIKIQPLYSQSRANPNAVGHHAGATDQWSIQQSYNSPFSLSEINTQLLQELEGGVSAIELTLSNNAQTTAPIAGIHCHTLKDLEQLFSGIHPQMIHTGLVPSANNLAAASLLDSFWQHQNIDRQKISAAFNADPIGTLAASGSLPYTQDNWSEQVVNLARHTIDNLPNVTSLCIDTSPYHNAGASEAQELAIAIATGVSYLRVLNNAGISVSDAAAQIVFRFALDSDFFLSVAKLQAARQLWPQVLSHCEIDDNNPAMTIRAQSGLRCLSVRDPWVNILRVTTQTFAAIIGGAQGFNSAAFDINCPQQSGLGRRIARNTQLILLEESKLDQIKNPLNGSGFVDTLTSELCSNAWQIFQQIEQQGGIENTLTTGFLQNLISHKRTQREHDIATGKTAIIGVSEFASLQQQSAEPDNRQAVQDTQPPPHDPLATYTVAEISNAINNGADFRSIDAHLRNNQITATALPRFRDSEVFENMVSRSEAYKDKHGKPPQVLLVTTGTVKDYSARTVFCTNFFASAGIDSHVVALENVSADNTGNPTLAVLCSSDKQYAEHAVEACRHLNSSANTEVWLAGIAADLEPQLIENGLAKQLHLKSNKVETLLAALTSLQVQ